MMVMERRSLRRFGLEAPAMVEFENGAKDARFIYLLTRDISGEGAYFHTADPLDIDAFVKIQIYLDVEKLGQLPVDGHVLVVADGRVLRSELAGMAVQFNDSCRVVPVS